MKRFLIIFSILFVAIIAFLVFLRVETKSHSPEEHVHFTDGDLTIDVLYSSPRKRDRVIFGELVPYDQVWRLGANEPTTFETNRELMFGDAVLPKGKYSLWAIPGKEEWELIFNAKVPGWALDIMTGEVNVNRAEDVLVVHADVVLQDNVFEEFNITIQNIQDGKEMILMWDQTIVSFPFNVK